MAALSTATREVFIEGVRAVLETWPVLQIAVDNGFGGMYSKQKAEWMVDAVQQYFHDNADLQLYEVEDFLSEVMNNEFDTMVDDGSLPQVAEAVCQMFRQCQQGKLSEVREQINQLVKVKGSGRVKATPVKNPAGEEEESEEEEEDAAESMECEAETEGSSSVATAQKQQEPSSTQSPDEDGWTVVRRRK
ncbi:pre-rRNA-processing protein TSR2 homolog [Chanos chanos]|uniref:Pre-rRNA-processing protein TSR2 homolog n=1 Tax=Chanos chanos TaxID=29144 RepID=A0A6J2W539_CHACN|nr:pre-rRNA-processing protein TSR2 homolog [Chanos chanos]